MIIFFLVIVIYVVINDIIPHIIGKDIKYLIINSILTVVSIIIIILYLLSVRLPKPSDLIEKAVYYIFGDLAKGFGR